MTLCLNCHICYCCLCFTMFIAKYFVTSIADPICCISIFCTGCSFCFCLCHRMAFCFNCHICYCRLCFTKFIAKYFVTGIAGPVCCISIFCTSCSFRFCLCHRMTFCLNCHICYCRLCFTMFIAEYFVTGTAGPICCISGFCTGCGFCFCFCHFMT